MIVARKECELTAVFIDSHIHLTHSLFDGTVPCIVGSKILINW